MQSHLKAYAFHRRKQRRKVGLFWLMLRTFILVIVLSICGMFGFVGFAIGRSESSQRYTDQMHRMPHVYTESLADFYVAQGDSWRGIDQRLADLSAIDPFGFPAITIVDEHDRVVASEDWRFPVGRVVERHSLKQGVPVQVQGRQIGTVILHETGFGRDYSGPPEFFWPMLRTLLGAGGVLALILLILATAFARRLSRPLRNLTTAAQSVAAGNLDVQVPSAHVRELDELAETFNRMARALADADRQRRQMTADVAHELRTPLAIIKGRLEGLQDGVYQASPEQIGRLLDETALLERMIDDLRTLALVEAGQLPLYLEQIDAGTLLEDTAATFATQAAGRGVRLQVTAPADLPAVHVDPQRMSQVFANLVTNALRYTPEGGRVTLSGVLRDNEANDCWVVLEVKDTGKGIAPEDLPHIFDRFWRADRARTRSSGGTGLGLAIARQIVVAHGGTIDAASSPNVGTTIRITLPCDRETEPVPA